VLLRDNSQSRICVGTFDYSDLNAYLLLVVGIAVPEEGNVPYYKELARRGREGRTIAVQDVKDIGKKDPLTTLPRNADLTKAVEIFGSGIHRILITEESSKEVVGILSQLTLVEFFWEHGRNFPALEPLFHSTLRELTIGSYAVIAIKYVSFFVPSRFCIRSSCTLTNLS
jgi:hypothetical protein